MEGPDDVGHYGTPSRHKSKPSSSQAATERVRQASQAAQMQVLGKLLKQAKEEEEIKPQAHTQVTQGTATPSKAQPTDTATAVRSMLEEAKQAARSAPVVGPAVAQRQKEARMLQDWFQAVWPDLGSFKTWGSATKVASMSGSLSLSLAFFGVVYWMSTRNEAPAGKQQQESKQAS